MLIDTHCHLNFKAFKKDLDEVIKNAKLAGVKKFVIPGARFNSSRKAVEIAQNYEGCYAAVGIHPHHALDFRDDLDQEFNVLCQSQKVVAVGEIGLDKHYYQGYPPPSEENFEMQKKLLKFQLEAAVRYSLPVILHCRDAYPELMEFLEKFGNAKLRAVLHCFEGDEKVLAKAVKWGVFIGIDGNITYQENQKRLALIKKIPLERLLLETDSPFLAPLSKRGQRNEPAFLSESALFIARLYNVSPESLSKTTSSNALNLFGLK